MKTWRFAVPLLIQTSFILFLLAQAVYIRITAKTIVLQTVPVSDHYDPEIYSQNLSYDISSQYNLSKLPGWDESTPIAQNTTIYVTLKKQDSSGKTPPLPWKPVHVSFTKPSSLAPNQVAIKGIYKKGIGNGSVNYNLETYYLPSDQRDKINKDISEVRNVQPGQSQPIVVEAKVDKQGNAIPLTLWVKNRNYRF